MKQAFNFKLQQPSVKITEDKSDYDYITNLACDLHSKHKADMVKFWGPHQLFPSDIANELIVQMPRNEIIRKHFVDGQGNLFFRISEKFYEEQLKQIVKENGALDAQQDFVKKSKVCVLFPFGEVMQKISLNNMRGINISESYARLQEYFQNQVVRSTVVQNQAPFHGIICAYLKQLKDQSKQKSNSQTESNDKRKENNANNISEKELQQQSKINFSDIAQFLIKQNLTSQKDVSNFGQLTLSNRIMEPELNEIFENLTQAATTNILEIYSRYIPLKKELFIIKADEIRLPANKFIEQLVEQQIAQIDKEGAYFIKLEDSKLVYIKDQYGNFTVSGQLLIILNDLINKHNTKQFFASSELQMDFTYQDINTCAQLIFGTDFCLKFWGHNNLFYENKNESKLNTFEDLLKQMRLLGLIKAKQKYPHMLPHLIENQQEALLENAFGWTRYLDHQKNRKVPYLIGVDDIISYIYKEEDFSNCRMKLYEILASYNLNKEQIIECSQQFQIKHPLERLLAKTLLHFPNILVQVTQDTDFRPLCMYVKNLFQICKLLQENKILANDAITITQLERVNRVTLLEGAGIVLTKAFYLLGIINN